MDPPCGIFPPSIIPSPRFVFLGCSIDNVKTTTTTQSLKKMFEESRKFSLKLNNKTNNILDCKRGGRGCVQYVQRRDERVFYMLMEHHALFLFTVLKPPLQRISRFIDISGIRCTPYPKHATQDTLYPLEYRAGSVWIHLDLDVSVWVVVLHIFIGVYMCVFMCSHMLHKM